MGAESSEKGRPGRAPGLSYQDMLAGDSKAVPETLRAESPQKPTSWYVPRDRYFSRDYHDLEVERLWRRVWQMACREEEIPEVGDHVVYEVGDLSILVVRSEADRVRAFHNTCLHRGT
ncbi:MAG: Rieske 2Fe-2S domain-containing protein, partial [Myxococcota bacterium]